MPIIDTDKQITTSRKEDPGMTLHQPKGISLRPYLPGDVEALAALFRASIEVLAEEDYDADQRAAWASAADDEAQFGAKLEACLTLVAESGTDLAGFISLKNNDTIEMLYTAPEFALRGVARFLCQATEMLAQGRKAGKLNVDASDTAQPLFEKLGFTPMQRNTVSRNGQWLANTSMVKNLQPSNPSGQNQ